MKYNFLTVFGIAVASLSLCVIAGCEEESSTDPILGRYKSWEQGTSYLWPHGEVVQIPDTVIVDHAFEVVVLTGLEGCDRPGPTQVFERADNIFEVVSQDSFFTGVWICPTVVYSTEHRVSMQFGTAGESIVLITTQVGSWASPEDSLVTLGYSVFVKPE